MGVNPDWRAIVKRRGKHWKSHMNTIVKHISLMSEGEQIAFLNELGRRLNERSKQDG